MSNRALGVNSAGSRKLEAFPSACALKWLIPKGGRDASNHRNHVRPRTARITNGDGGSSRLHTRRRKGLTGDANQPAAEAVALAGERIRAVGPNAEIRRLAGPRTRVIDLHGRTVIAGLIDAHVHLLGGPGIVDEPSLRNFERTALPKP